MKIVTVVGARPQFIKAAVLSRTLNKHHHEITESIIHTGQHFDKNMSDIFFKELEIPQPDYNLEVCEPTHGRMTGKILSRVEDVILRENPDCVVVYGDTNSTLAGALAAAKLHIPVAHVEAGLRSFNKRMPEEINRVLCDHVSEILFCPTTAATENLYNEGIKRNVYQVGDVMYDAALYYAELSAKKSRALQKFNLEPRGYILVTIHRAENTDDPGRMRAIFTGLSTLAEEIPVFLPVHPRTRDKLEKQGLYRNASKNLIISEPVGYLDMINLEKNASLVVTDSGGVQKEAYFHDTPCVTLRDETEWVELVTSGWNTLCPPGSADHIHKTIRFALSKSYDSKPMLYGDGTSGEKIAEILAKYF